MTFAAFFEQVFTSDHNTAWNVMYLFRTREKTRRQYSVCRDGPKSVMACEGGGDIIINEWRTIQRYDVFGKWEEVGQQGEGSGAEGWVVEGRVVMVSDCVH